MLRSPDPRRLVDDAARGLVAQAALVLLVALRVRADARRALRWLPVSSRP